MTKDEERNYLTRFNNYFVGDVDLRRAVDSVRYVDVRNTAEAFLEPSDTFDVIVLFDRVAFVRYCVDNNLASYVFRSRYFNELRKAGCELVGGEACLRHFAYIIPPMETMLSSTSDSSVCSEVGLNNCFFKTEQTITHDELRFRSRAEIAIYQELVKRKLLFFPNAAAVLGGKKVEKREPDFLICQAGKWGILEVMGEALHTSDNAVKDHDRARLFKDFGILCVEFFDADKYKTDPAAVVDKFLSILAKH